jgi:hypothetical protein
MECLGNEVSEPVSVYLAGGATAVLRGWRETTIDVDIKPIPDQPVLRVIPRIKETLQLNIELASPGDFIPVKNDWQTRSPLIDRYGQATYHHYEFDAQALSKIERGHRQDLVDVAEMLSRQLVSSTSLMTYFAEIEPELYRFPAIDPASFKAALASALDT